MSTISSVTSFDNVAELLERLGHVSPARICLRPPPGQATERDLLVALERHKRRYELVEGTLVEKGMGFNESFLAAEILVDIGIFVRKQNLGIVTGEACPFRLLQGLVRMPDVSFLVWGKLPGRVLPKAAMPDLVPDLAVEVLSESNTAEEMERKLGEYFLAGVRLVWIIDPTQRTASVYTKADAPDCTLSEKQSLDGGDVLPGFTLSLADLFARLPAPTRKSRSTRKKKS